MMLGGEVPRIGTLAEFVLCDPPPYNAAAMARQKTADPLIGYPHRAEPKKAPANQPLRDNTDE
jgi:hypothetical protein